jgi:hypothetical protein
MQFKSLVAVVSPELVWDGSLNTTTVPLHSILCWEVPKVRLFPSLKNAELTVAVLDVLGDLGVRQAIKQMPKNARL